MSWPRLVAAVRGFYAEQDDGPGRPLMQEAAAVLAACEGQAPEVRGPVRLPVERHLVRLTGAAGGGAAGEITAALLACAEGADWQQNPNYTRESVGAQFVDNYGYVEFVGPGRRWDCPHLRVGVLVLGPRVAYADHAHPAEEVYHPIAGQASWWREGLDWHTVPTGTAIHHAPWVRHAMRTEAEPLVALYCWGGEIGPAAEMTDGKNARPG